MDEDSSFNRGEPQWGGVGLLIGARQGKPPLVGAAELERIDVADAEEKKEVAVKSGRPRECVVLH